MDFKSVRKKVLEDFATLVEGSENCLNGKHCPEAWPLPPPATHAGLPDVTFGQHHGHYARYLTDVLSGFGATVIAVKWVGHVYLSPLQVPFAVTIDRLGYVANDVGVGDNVRMGIYADNGDTPAGGVLLAETASVASVYGKNELTISSLALQARLYWLAYQNQNGNVWVYSAGLAAGWVGTLNWKHYDGFFPYGPFANPCPAAPTHQNGVTMFVRVASTP